MKREELKAAGVPEEALDAVMQLHQTDTTKWQDKLNASKAEITAKDKKITELTDSIKKFDGVDVKALQDSVETWKEKYTNDINDMRKSHLIEKELIAARPKDVKALQGFLDLSKVTIDGESLTGLAEQLNSIRTENGWLFEQTEPSPEPKEPVRLGGGHDNPPNNAPDTLFGAVAEHYNK